MKRILVALSLLGSLPACLRVTNACDEQAGPCLNVDVRGAVGPIDTVHLRLQGQGNVEEEELVELPGSKELPISLGVLLPDNAEGEISITATGSLRGAGRGQGIASANLQRGGRATAIVVLGPYCGDGAVNGSEACDDGNTSNDDDCPMTCRRNVCGDGFVDQQGPQTESCDDGNTATENACPYGQATCVLCDATCATVLNLTGPYCGDSNTDTSAGEQCDDGNTSNGDDCLVSCRPNVCGDGFIDQQGPRIETCDDGNTATETACPYGTPSCTACDATCATELSLSGPYCGDGATNGPENCDDGNITTEAACPYGQPTCVRCDASCLAILNLRGPYCGDGTTNGPENCDDGNTTTETTCAYGTTACTACNATCTTRLNLIGPYCGDGTTNGPEICDDGNTNTETACPYGQPACMRCNASCSAALNLNGPYCGDGIVNGPEACDDGNNLACGTCNMTCTMIQEDAATGSITAIGRAEINDGQTFTLNDGVNTPTIFEFDLGTNTAPGRIRIAVPSGSTATNVAASIAEAINGVDGTLLIGATVSASDDTVVNLTNDQPGSFGNQPISETVTDSGFRVIGMSGGSGHDCPAGTSCTTNADCASGLTCQGTGPKICQ